MASANEALATSNPEDLDIENVGEGDEQYVEMVGLSSLPPSTPFTVVSSTLLPPSWSQGLTCSYLLDFVFDRTLVSESSMLV